MPRRTDGVHDSKASGQQQSAHRQPRVERRWGAPAQSASAANNLQTEPNVGTANFFQGLNLLSLILRCGRRASRPLKRGLVTLIFPVRQLLHRARKSEREKKRKSEKDSQSKGTHRFREMFQSRAPASQLWNRPSLTLFGTQYVSAFALSMSGTRSVTFTNHESTVFLTSLPTFPEPSNATELVSGGPQSIVAHSQWWPTVSGGPQSVVARWLLNFASPRSLQLPTHLSFHPSPPSSHPIQPPDIDS